MMTSVYNFSTITKIFFAIAFFLGSFQVLFSANLPTRKPSLGATEKSIGYTDSLLSSKSALQSCGYYARLEEIKSFLCTDTLAVFELNVYTETSANKLSNYSVLWENGKTVKQDTLKTNIWHTVTITDSLGCTSKIQVYSYDDPILNNARIFCHYNCTKNTYIYEIDRSNLPKNYTIRWSTGETTTSIERPDLNNYSVAIPLEDGCTRVIRYDVGNFRPFTVYLYQIYTDGCNLDSMSYNIRHMYRYPTTTTYNELGYTIVGSKQGRIVAVKATDYSGCIAHDTIVLTIPDIVNRIDSYFYCPTDTLINLKIQGPGLFNTTETLHGLSYKWSTGDTTREIKVQSLTSITYTVTVTDNTLGCQQVLSYTTTPILADIPKKESYKFTPCDTSGIWFEDDLLLYNLNPYNPNACEPATGKIAISELTNKLPWEARKNGNLLDLYILNNTDSLYFQRIGDEKRYQEYTHMFKKPSLVAFRLRDKSAYCYGTSLQYTLPPRGTSWLPDTQPTIQIDTVKAFEGDTTWIPVRLKNMQQIQQLRAELFINGIPDARIVGVRSLPKEFNGLISKDSLGFSFSKDSIRYPQPFNFPDDKILFELGVYNPSQYPDSLWVMFGPDPSRIEVVQAGNPIRTPKLVYGFVHYIPGASVYGTIVNTKKEPLPGLPVQINYTTVTTTDAAGRFATPKREQYTRFTLAPFMNRPYFNKVSILDMIAIRAYILGVKPFDNPYQLLAADVNGDKTISMEDFNDVQKYIQGNISGFQADGKTWDFIPKRQTFSDDAPLQTSWFNYVNVALNEAPVYDQDFTGIQLGDIDNTVKPKSAAATPAANLVFTDQWLEPGKSYQIPVFIETESPIAGLQFSLIPGQSGIQLLNAKTAEQLPDSNAMVVKDEYIRFVSIFPADKKKAGKQPSAFNLEIRTNKRVLLSDAILLDPQFESHVISREMEYGTLDLWFGFRPTARVSGVSKRKTGNLQAFIFPNPASGNQTARILSDKIGTATIEVMDVHGKSVFRFDRPVEKGWNDIALNQQMAKQPAGVYSFRITLGTVTQVGQFIQVE